MPTIFSGRITLIAAIVLAALYCIFPSPSLYFDHSKTFLQRTGIKPGIDMVGGVSLIYEIHAPEGSDTNGLAAKMIEILKKRVDPDGVLNYVWRPEGNTRIEIQVPTAGNAEDVKEKSQAYSQAQQDLDETNIRKDAVVRAVEQTQGNNREQELSKLDMGSKTRQDIFRKMTDTWDQIQTLKANKDHLSQLLLATKIQPLAATYEQLKGQIDATNLPHETLEQVLDRSASDAKASAQELSDFRKEYADFPRRIKAIDNFEAQWKDYQSVKSAVTDATDLKRKLQSSGVLEFHILADSTTVADRSKLEEMNARLRPGGRGPLPAPGDTMRWVEVDRPEEFDKPGGIPETHEWNGKHYMLVLTTLDASLDRRTDKWGLDDADHATNNDGEQESVTFKFNPVGGRLFGELTEHWVQAAKERGGHARLGIVLDNKLVSASDLNTAIYDRGEITGGGNGGFSTTELNYLVTMLKAGSLPAQLSSEPVSEENFQATLGAENLYRGLIACGFGLIVVGVFLIGYYFKAGMVAFFAVLLNLVLILGTLAAWGATFTLPCIAGIVLTVGTAVDANVLVFERLREEQHRRLPLKMAMKNSYDRAFSAIVDSNMTSAITSLFLYWFGSEEIKGFGLTLLIGILWSLFTSLFVTKTIFGIMIEKFGVTDLGSLPLSLPKLDKALKPNWDWMGKAWIFYTFSIVAIAIGMVLFARQMSAGKMMAIEFTSGTSVQFGLNEKMDIDDVRKLIDAEAVKRPNALSAPTVVAVGTDQLHYEVVTSAGASGSNSVEDRAKVKDAVLEAMAGKLHIQTPSTFDQVDQPFDQAQGKSIVPITDASVLIDGSFTPPAAQEGVGGVAVVLRNISPPLKPSQIRARLDAERLSSGVGGNTIDYAVQAPTGDAPTNFAVIVGWNPSVAWSADRQRWQQQLAEPLWTLANQAIDRPLSLEKEVNFDAQVAGEMKRDALLSLSFSIVVIMAYIWLRFGNLKYGTATVIALLHDTIFTLAAMGYAHYISYYWPNNFLQVQPFRVDLTVVAGVLTIMGYSMIDTIVVFDRIRENRGKYGHLDRGVINAAINQTLSRTLLTAGTTIITVSFMYFLGGSGIHAFTFVLLVGILVGSYSSVAIAAPLLLLGKETATVGSTQAPLAQYRQTPVGQG